MEKFYSTAYDEDRNMTFVLRETLDGGDLVEIEVTGFYFGPPCEENTREYFDQLKATF